MKILDNIELPRIPTKTDFINEGFTIITTKGSVIVEMQYPILGMNKAEPNCYLRNEAAQRLYHASTLLPNNYYLKIYDAWRSFALQEELYLTYKQRIINDFNLQKLSPKEQNEIITKYVSFPRRNINTPPVHTTGGAVDVTIVDERGLELQMGTKFDDFSAMANTAYFENRSDIIIRDNRRLLYNVMTKAGFTNLPSEWWHYDYGDWFWSYYSGHPVLYQGVFSKEDLNDYC